MEISGPSLKGAVVQITYIQLMLIIHALILSLNLYIILYANMFFHQWVLINAYA